MNAELARAEAQKDLSFSEALWAALEREGCEGTPLLRIEHAAGPAWLVRFRPDVELTHRFGLCEELLLLAVGGEMSWPAIREAQTHLQSADLDLEPDLMLLIDSGERLCERIATFPRQREHRVPWELTQSLEETLERWLPRYDLFDMRDPVRGRRVVGRRAERAHLAQLLGAGGGVGVFGLRKVGKTTLVRAVTDALEPQTAERVAWVDAQGLVRRDVHHLAHHLLAELGFASHHSSPSPAQRSLSDLDMAFRTLLEEGKRVIVVVDEFDYLLEGEPREVLRVEGILGFFGLCRSWSQRAPGQLALVLIGRDPEHLAKPRLAGVPNPLLAWLRELWLGPMPSEEASELLVSLGRKVGLTIGAATVASCLSQTGGHPLLVRRFGSCALHVARQTERWSTDALLGLIEAAFASDRAAHTLASEVEALLRERYPDAFAHLCARAAGVALPAHPVLQRFGVEVRGEVPSLWLRWFRAVRPLAVAS